MKRLEDWQLQQFGMDVLINDDSRKYIFQLEIRTHFGDAARELVVET